MSTYTTEEKKLILEVVDKAIEYGLKFHRPWEINPNDYPEKLRENGASFVTLKINNMLRGCIGTLEACQPLISDIAQNAYSAAFCDPRFFPLTKEEYPKVTKHISVLTKPTPMCFKGEEDLLKQLCPNVDGLILSDQGYRGTFLPSVWESCPTPQEFIKCLKMKCGLPENYWSSTIKAERYCAEVIE